MKVTIELNSNRDLVTLEKMLKEIGEFQEDNHHIKEFNVVVRIG